ncbi:MAG: glycosyltransferase [Spirulinaceae cyanobacterium SM2_1_0]|nr:glycosyltransferase [Spirulinaceae cyanobacterium SM2_1_0]
MPTISIVTPAYNAQQTIGATIESVLAQTYRDFELIIVDDGSQDETAAVVRGYDDPRIRLYVNSNTGAAASRNHGFTVSTGDYIAFLDADDLWLPGKLAMQLQALQAHQEASVAYSWTDWIDTDGQPLRHGGYATFSGDVLAPLLVVNFLEHGSNPLIRRAAVIAVGGFDATLPASQDWDFYLRLAARYQFVNVPVVHIFYRVSPNSISTDLPRLERSCTEMLARAFASAPSQLQYLRSQSFGNLYKYLTFRALERSPQRSDVGKATRFWWHAACNDPKLWRAKVSARILLRLGLTLVLPDSWLLHLRTKRLFSNFDALLGYICISI